MVFGRRFINPPNQLWKFTNNESIILFVDPRKSCSSKKMEHKYTDHFEHFEEHNHLRLCSIESSQKSRTRYKRIQSSCYNFLERPNGILSVSYHFALFGLVVVGLVFAILETMSELNKNKGLRLGTYILEVFLLIVFFAEYILRMWSAGCRSTYSGLLGRVRFAFKPFVIVDIVVIASTCAVIVYSLGQNRFESLSILRFFQVLRMVRFDRQGGSWKLLGSVLFLHKKELLTTFYIGFCSLIFASFFVYQAEKTENELEFGTFADSFWWGVVTLTTVGYGDKVPRSWAGRGVAAFFAIMGISFFALPAGILGSGFALKVSQQERQKHVKRRRRPAAMLIQCNWRYYASQKNSKLTATWLPYVKYLQENNSLKKDGHNSEKPSQPPARVRKISIFGRKASGISTEGLHKPTDNSIAEQGRRRSRKGMRNELFQSNDSLQDGHSYSTADQHTDDEHVSNHAPQKRILITDARGNTSLPSAYKQSIRFTRYLKFLVALRKFKLAKKPYDVKDVIEQYTTGHVEVLGKVKSIGNKIDEALGYKVGTEKVNENSSGRTNVVHRLSKLEKQVKTLDTKLDRVIGLLEEGKRQRQTLASTLCEEQQSCSNCGHSYDYSHQSERRSSEDLPEMNQECKKPARRRKVGMSNQSLNVSLSERQELAANEGRNSGCLPSKPNYGENSLHVETDGRNFLSPRYGYGYGDSHLSRQSSAYGISDNCPSPNPSSSDESYHSKDEDQCNMLSPDGVLALYGESCQDNHHDDQIPSDGMHPFGQSYHTSEHGGEGFISPSHELYRASNDIPPRYGASNKGYEGNSAGSTGDHISPNYGYLSGDHFSTDLSAATSPSLYGCNQLPDCSRIPGVSYQSPQDFDHSTVMVPPPPSSVSSQYGDTSTGTNQSPERRIPELNYQPPSETGQDLPSSNWDRTDDTNHGDDVSEEKILLEERPLLERHDGCIKNSPGITSDTIRFEENPASGYGERLPDQALSQQAHSCHPSEERRSDCDYQNKNPKLELCLEDNPLAPDGESLPEKSLSEDHGEKCPRTCDSAQERRTSDDNYPERDTKCETDENYHPSFPQDEHARANSACFSVDSESKEPYDEASAHSSDSEQSNGNARDRSRDNDVTVVISRTSDDMQETRM